MSSFNDSGGEDGGDICNIFDFGEDDDVVGRMQSAWDEDTSTKMKKRKFKALLSDGDLSVHFSDRLKAIACCSRKDCSCLLMLHDPDMCSALVSDLILFEQKSKYEQDSIILQWVIYWFKIPGFNGWSMDGYHVPFDGSCFDGKEWLTDKIRSHYLCVWGLQSVMGLGKYQWRMIGQVSKSTAIMPQRYSRMSNAAMKAGDPRSAPLKHHLDYLLELVEVQATRVVATLSDGSVQGHANRKDMVDMMLYLPILMGYRNCYKRYMHSLGYKIRCKPDGALIVDGVVDGKPSYHGYISYLAYYNKWKREYPQLKVSRPAEDICNHCFIFANRRRYFAKHSTTETLATMVTTAATPNNDGDMTAAATMMEAIDNDGNTTAVVTTAEAADDNGDTTVVATSTEAKNNDGDMTAAATMAVAPNDDCDMTAAATMTETMDNDGNTTAAAATTEAMDDNGNTTSGATSTEAMNNDGGMTAAATMTEATTDDGNTAAAATTTEATDDNGNTTAAATRTEATNDDDDDDDNGNTAATTMEETTTPISIDQPKFAATEVEETREQLLLDAAKHIQMVREQRALYQAYVAVAEAVCDATDGKLHFERRYTFMVDYGQNMQVPIFNNEQPGSTYYLAR